MTILGRKNDREPVTCACCGRYSEGYGYSAKGRDDVLWSCGAPDCLEALKRIAKMSDKDLHRFECVAIAESGREAFGKLFPAFLDGMWNEGVRSLEQMTPDMVEKAKTEIVNGPEYQRALAAFLLDFGKSIHGQLVKGDAPF